MTTNDFEKAKERALRLLARRDHSAYELRTKLRQKIGISQGVWDEVHAYLKNLGYLVDENDLTARWVKQWRQEGRGRHWISGKLRSKGLPPAQLQDDDTEVEAALHTVQKKLGTRSLKSLKLNEKAKISRSLISRGFSSSIVAIVLNDRI